MTESRHQRPPDFIIAGAPKSGTHTLHAALSEHQGVCMAITKEPRFFIHTTPDEAPEEPSTTPLSGNFERGWDWYESLYRGASAHALRGEASPQYFHAPKTVGLLEEHVPHVRLLFVLRDPIERMYSHYWQDRRTSDLPNFEDLQRSRPDRFEYYARISRYSDHLSRFAQTFADSRIFVCLTEDLRDDPSRVIARAFNFLGLDPLPSGTAPDRRHYSAGILRSMTLHRALVRSYPVAWVPSRAKVLGRAILERIQHWNLKPQAYPPMRTETRQALLDLFAPDIERLEGLLGRDLGNWKLV